MARLYSSIADGMEDVLGNIPMLDQLSLANAIASQTPHQAPKSVISGETIDAAEAEAELSAFEDKEAEPFVKPICDIFLEVFELNRGSNWLRGRAVVVVLQQLLGGTIERKVREQAKGLLDEESLLKYAQILKDNIWPDGVLRPGLVMRTPKEKVKTRTEARVILATLVPGITLHLVFHPPTFIYIQSYLQS
jgi:sorting nexin-25